MNELEIKSKLDQLSDFQAHRDLLDADKRTLLDDVKIPAEVEAIVKAGMQQMSGVMSKFDPYLSELMQTTAEKIATIHAAAQVKLAAIVVPDEIKTMLAEIDRKRAEVTEQRTKEINELNGALEQVKTLTLGKINAEQMAIQAETEAATAGVYASIAQRKAEIEAEFAGKAEAVDENIKKLTEEIKKEVALIGFTVKGEHLRAEWGKGKKSWIPQRLDKYTETHPDIKDCYTVGEPNVSIKRI